MKNKISTTKKNITAYLALCFLITYITWGSIAVYSQLYNVNFTEYAWMYVLYIIGVLSPAISATIIQCKLNHYTLKQNISYIFKKPNNKIDWFICLLLSFLFSFLPYILMGGEKLGSIINIFISIPMFFIIGGLEEVGWRGFLLENILSNTKNSKFLSVLTIGCIWELWHLPLFFMVGTYQEQYLSFGIHTLWTIATSFILGAIYIRSHSTIVCILSHCIINSVTTVFIVNVSWYEAIIKLIVCMLVFIILVYCKPKNSRQK